MQRSTLGMARTSDAHLDVAWNIPATDQRFVDILNQAQRRLLMRGKYWGTYARYTIALTSQILTLPPEIDTIEKVAESSAPLTLRGLWHEFNGNGCGTRDEQGWHPADECSYRGNFPVIADITTPGTLTVKCDVSTDATKPVLILGIDTNGNYVRTQVGGVWQDGETVLLAQGAGTNTVTQFSRVLGVQPPTNLDGQWWLYQGGVTGQLLGQYQYWDNSPSWKRYLVPFVQGATPSVEIIGKKAFVPVKKDTDYLVVGNLDAIKLAGLSVLAEERGEYTKATLLFNGGMTKAGPVMGAVQELEAELRHHLGAGQEPSLRFMGSNIGSVQPIESIL